ncbi:MAG: sigma-70 family RNA polymerase sigma factor [Hyphomonadaceae bacterium]|nr:sigma-70 family RNA polymerase sigma factor [Hyphomonadaceae bacterium]
MAIEADALRDEIVALLPRLRRFARALAGHPADADDLVQIAVERALMRMDQFQRGTRLEAWLFAIVRNAWLDEARARQRRARIFAPAEEGENAGDARVSSAEARLQVNALQRAMQALPAEQREAVALVCVEGLGYREAAETLGVPQGTLTSRLARGRDALMRMMGETP